jgi:II/X family phage/plasmid replication protein
MLDTLKLCSPYISEASASVVQQACVVRLEVSGATGVKNWEIVTGQLAGSFDHCVSVRVEREEWAGVKGSYKVECDPYIVIEGSVHKALLGHNVYGGPLPFALSACWFVDHVAAGLGVSLPYAEDWTVQRVDWAEAYELPSLDACSEYIGGLNLARFPRRLARTIGNQTLMFAGTTTAWKIYHKGPEFWKHDRKRVRAHLSDDQLLELQERANCILRLETSIKAKKLTADFGAKPTVVQVTREYLERVHDKETARLLREAKNDVEIVRTYREVSRRLHEKHDSRLANILFGTWIQLSAVGQEEVKKTLSVPTWYRQRRQLTEAGVSWHATDVHIEERCSAVPRGFSPVRSDCRRLLDEAEEVQRQLYTYSRPVPKDLMLV